MDNTDQYRREIVFNSAYDNQLQYDTSNRKLFSLESLTIPKKFVDGQEKIILSISVADNNDVIITGLNMNNEQVQTKGTIIIDTHKFQQVTYSNEYVIYDGTKYNRLIKLNNQISRNDINILTFDGQTVSNIDMNKSNIKMTLCFH